MIDWNPVAVEALNASDKYAPAVVVTANALYAAEQALTDLIKAAMFARDNLLGAVSSADDPAASKRRMGLPTFDLMNALSAAQNPGASGTISSNAEKALTNLTIAYTAIRIARSA